MTQRTGMPTIIELSKALCLAVVRFAPVIRAVTNNDPAVNAALAAALAACEALTVALTDYLEPGD